MCSLFKENLHARPLSAIQEHEPRQSLREPLAGAPAADRPPSGFAEVGERLHLARLAESFTGH